MLNTVDYPGLQMICMDGSLEDSEQSNIGSFKTSNPRRVTRIPGTIQSASWMFPEKPSIVEL